MTIFVNDKEFSFEGPLSLGLLLKQIELKDLRGMAVAVNDRVVPKNNWDSSMLNENDRVILIKAARGG